jgi:hypothetical protein
MRSSRKNTTEISIKWCTHSQKGIARKRFSGAFREKHGENAENADFHKKMRAYVTGNSTQWGNQDTDEADPG